mmetsp:Transcript_1399/g.4202  ORF Transcript_1399/g.4202 Transcript_1399/m.4202 type:complete len:233 (-) Transcript_1399:2490-3188(-)
MILPHVISKRVNSASFHRNASQSRDVPFPRKHRRRFENQHRQHVEQRVLPILIHQPKHTREHLENSHWPGQLFLEHLHECWQLHVQAIIAVPIHAIFYFIRSHPSRSLFEITRNRQIDRTRQFSQLPSRLPALFISFHLHVLVSLPLKRTPQRRRVRKPVLFIHRTQQIHLRNLRLPLMRVRHDFQISLFIYLATHSVPEKPSHSHRPVLREHNQRVREDDGRELNHSHKVR